MLLKTPFILKTFSKEAGKETAFPFFFFFLLLHVINSVELAS